MKKILILLVFAFCQIIAVNGQQLVRGTVQDSSGIPLIGAIIKLKFPADSIAAVTDVNGAFVFRTVKHPQFSLSAAYLGFQTFVKQYRLDASRKEVTLPLITLKTASNTLNEVVITAVPPVRVKEDTVEFNAGSFPVREGDAIEEVIKKLPGVAVDRDGNVTTQGKPITKVRVNGKDFFGEDVATAIQNLPADIVKNLQVIDDYGDQANLTGIKTGEPEKILNINIQEDKNRGYFARSTGGVGNSDRYVANLRANAFSDERRISFNGTMNNVNMRGGGGDGITSNKSAGLNYRNQWNKKLSANAGYNFQNRRNNTIGTEFTQNFRDTTVRLENERSNNTSQSNNHNFWGNVEYQIDTLNYLKFSPNFSFNQSENNSSGSSNISLNNLVSATQKRSLSDAASLNTGANLFYNHKFLRKGRNFNVYTFFNFSRGETFRDVRNDYTEPDSFGVDSTTNQYQLTESNNQNTRLGASVSYSEPLSKSSFLELRYNWSRSSTSTGRDTRDLKNGFESVNFNLSNSFQYQFTTNRVGLNYRFLKEQYHYTIGFSAQPAVLSGYNVSKDVNTYNKTLNWIPSARFVYKFSKQKTFSLNYNGRNNQPGFNQLQPLTDSTNIQNVVVGNPDLKPEFTHGLNMEYNQSDWKQGHTLFANFSFSQTENKIVTTKGFVPNKVGQVTSYTNTDGFYNMRGRYAYSKPFSERKYTLTLEGEGSINNNVAFINNERNIGKNFLISQGLEFELDIKDIVDLELETTYSINKTQYSNPSFNDRQTNRLALSLEGRNYFFKDLTLGYDLSKQINRGFNNASIQNPTILHVYMEYRFLKGNAGSLRLQGYDLFNQNTGISRDVFDYVIVDRQTNRLGRYFLMSFNLRLRKFGQ